MSKLSYIFFSGANSASKQQLTACVLFCQMFGSVGQRTSSTPLPRAVAHVKSPESFPPSPTIAPDQIGKGGVIFGALLFTKFLPVINEKVAALNSVSGKIITSTWQPYNYSVIKINYMHIMFSCRDFSTTSAKYTSESMPATTGTEYCFLVCVSLQMGLSSAD